MKKSKDGWMIPVWDMYIGPMEELKNVSFRKGIPSSEWMSALIDWTKVVGDVQEQAPPALPNFLRGNIPNETPKEGQVPEQEARNGRQETEQPQERRFREPQGK
jgi:hypothetical protein